MRKEKQIHCHLFGEECTHSTVRTKNRLKGVPIEIRSKGACASCTAGQEEIRSRMKEVARVKGLGDGDFFIFVGQPNLGATELVGSLVDNTKRGTNIPYEAARIEVKKGRVKSSFNLK